MGLKDKIITNTTILPPKGILYGAPGVGKTTFAANAEALIIDCEGGANTIIGAKRSPYLDTYDDIMAWINPHELKDMGIKVVAIDTIDWLVRRMVEHVSGSTGKLSNTLNTSNGGYGAGGQVLQNHIYQLLIPKLNKIVENGISVLLLAHAKRENITDHEGISIEKNIPQLDKHSLPVFIEWADFVCYAMKKPDKSRTIITEEDHNTLAKNRYNMDAEIPFPESGSWSIFTGAISAGISKKMKNKEK